MKKMISLACALMMMLGVSAQIRKSGQMIQEDAISGGIVSYLYGATAGSYTYQDNEYAIMFKDKDGNNVAYVEIATPSKTSLQGAYHLGDGASMFVAKVYDGETAYPMTSGSLFLLCTGTQQTQVSGYGNVTYYIYEVQALNWCNKNNNINVTDLYGTVALPVVNYKTQQPMTLTDVAMQATEISLTAPQFGTSSDGSYWEFKAFDAAVQNGLDLYAFADSVYYQGNGYYSIEGAYDVYSLMYDGENLLSQIFINGADVTEKWTNFFGYILEKEVQNGRKFAVSFYFLINNAWYHMTGVYDSTASGVEEVEAAETEGTAKVMKDGQLIIIRNGVRYNAQGAVIE